LHNNSVSLKGWGIHNGFGLRKEWLHLYLAHPHDWELGGGLGNRQIESLRAWLKTTGLHDRRGKETSFCALFRESAKESLFPWELLWINVVFNFPTAAWYVEDLGLGEWSTSEMRVLLSQHCMHLASRTVSNAIMELVGLLERTPVGKELRQGDVIPSRPRYVRREGLSSPSDKANCYALCRLFDREQRKSLSMDEQLLWPWVVFGCRKNHVMQWLVLDGRRWFEIREDRIALIHPLEEVLRCGCMLITSR